MSDKEIKKELINYYINIFLSYDTEYSKKDMRTYANYDDWRDIKYISLIKQLEDNLLIQFQIKKSNIRLYLEVSMCNKDGSNTRSLRLYHDLFYLKKKDKIKTKILNIVDNVKYSEIMKLSGAGFKRNLKLKEIKSKI